jgi:hypothetical protein
VITKHQLAASSRWSHNCLATSNLVKGESTLYRWMHHLRIRPNEQQQLACLCNKPMTACHLSYSVQRLDLPVKLINNNFIISQGMV